MRRSLKGNTSAPASEPLPRGEAACAVSFRHAPSGMECGATMSKSQSYLESLQKLHALNDEASEHLKQDHYWKCFEDTCVLQAYSDGKLSLILNCDTRFEANDARSQVLKGERGTAPDTALFICRCDSANLAAARQPKREQMLIRNVEFVKNVKDARIIPSLVRLYVGENAIEERFASGVYLDTTKAVFNILSLFFGWGSWCSGTVYREANAQWVAYQA